jgi:predicted  nucleic acid-binding Zn-ribbon protein
MSELLNAVDQIKSWANKQRAIVVLADQLERIGSLEQAEAETQQRLKATQAKADKARKDLEATEQKLADAGQEVDRVQAIAKQELQASRERIGQEEVAAAQRIKTMTGEAQAHAAEIVRQAAEQAQAIDTQAARTNRELVAVQAQIEQAQKALTDYQDQLDAAKAKARAALSSFA